MDSDIDELRKELVILRRENEILRQRQPTFYNTMHRNRHSDEFWERVEKACKNDADYIRALIKNKTINMYDTDKNGRTLLIICASCGAYELTQLCLNLDADINHQANDGESAIQKSELFADVKQLLLFSELNANIGNRIKQTAQIINKQNGFIQNINNVLQEKYDDDNTRQFFKDTLIVLMTEIIEQKLAFSDDILNLCWSFEPDPLNSDLWKTIETVCTDIINNGNKLDWFWMKTYIVPSTV